MWVNVWYYLGSQMIALAAAFGLSLCFESPFIRLEKLWIGSLLQSVMPSQSGHAKKNGKVHEQQTVHILDEIIKRLDREEEEKQPNLQGWRQRICQGVGGTETVINCMQGCDDPFGEWITDCVRAT